MAALEKELSLTALPKPATELQSSESLTQASNNDIAKLKQILESDGDDEEQQQQPQLANNVPKLSDLSKIALNSSLKSSDIVKDAAEAATEAPQQQHRELSVEEALAEMYQQIGVASDAEDNETEADAKQLLDAAAGSGQDVLLINLAEIFDNSSSDLYVVQCDMNENILGVVEPDDLEQQQPSEGAGAAVAAAVEQTNTQQLIELLAEPESDHFDATPLIHHEEVVPDSCSKLSARRQFLKYLHGKYVQNNVSRYDHGQRVLRKYKRRLLLQHKQQKQQQQRRRQSTPATPTAHRR